MLSLLFIWIYMTVFAFVLGLALTQVYQLVFNALTDKKDRMNLPLTAVLVSGLLGMTLYAQIFSLFYRVNWEANLLLLLCLGIYAWTNRIDIKERVAEWKKKVFPPSENRYLNCFFVGALILAVIVFAFASSGEVKMIDTDWYHAQTIRWIEEFGSVKGIGNLFPSLGHNNAQHYLDALFSLPWVFGQSMRSTGGYFGILIFFDGWRRLLGRNKGVVGFLALWEITYSIIVTAFFTKPYVDTLPNVLILFVLTEWVALVIEDQLDIRESGFYSLLCVFAIVCKTSVAPMVLLALYPLIRIIKEKRYRLIVFYLLSGLLIALPWLITNVITTGYVFFLLPALDLFEVGWKMDGAIMEHMVDSMIAFARNREVTIEEALSSKIGWIPGWFRAESISHQILYLYILIVIAVDAVMVFFGIIKEKICDFRLLLPRMCVYIGLIYWFITIPQVRYCWSLLIFPVAFVPVYYWEKNRKNPVFGALIAGSILLMLMYAGFYTLRTVGYAKEGLIHYPYMQADYRKYDLEEVREGSLVFYVRKETGDIVSGYYAFPYLDNIKLLEEIEIGNELKDGFTRLPKNPD